MYLPVPIFGYVCDRHDPRPLSLFAGTLFGAGYLLAAFTYKNGDDPHSGSWPVEVMLLAFVGIGMGATSMYLSAVSTCAKNFGRGKHRGLALALPITAIGLSGMWQTQVGSQLFYERDTLTGGKGDVNVFQYFLFLAGLLFAVGVLGSLTLKVVDEEELIDEGISEFERSGLLADSPLSQRSLLHGISDPSSSPGDGYGTLTPQTSHPTIKTASLCSRHSSEDKRRKIWLLNTETRLFLTDPTMWFLAAGFFLVTGPGEAFINNLGTVIFTLYPPPSRGPPPSNSPATHVSIFALTSTLARLLIGTLSDYLAPTQSYPSDRFNADDDRRPTVSRLVFLLSSTALLSLGQLLLASGLVQNHPQIFALVSSLQGLGYGAVFSLTPIIISVIWGVQNFGTNWGVVVVMPAGGAALWGAVYSAVYEAGVETAAVGHEKETRCFGSKCYAATFWGMTICSWVAMGLWIIAWRRWRRRDIAV